MQDSNFNFPEDGFSIPGNNTQQTNTPDINQSLEAASGTGSVHHDKLAALKKLSPKLDKPQVNNQPVNTFEPPKQPLESPIPQADKSFENISLSGGSNDSAKNIKTEKTPEKPVLAQNPTKPQVDAKKPDINSEIAQSLNEEPNKKTGFANGIIKFFRPDDSKNLVTGGKQGVKGLDSVEKELSNLRG